MSSLLERDEREAIGDDRTAFNLAVWDKIVADPEFAAMPHRFETDEHGQIIMSPPPAPSHGSKQSRISRFLGNMASEGEVASECPVSTLKGVKAVDVAWCSPVTWEGSKGKSCLVRAPELCVEILSPSNSESEIEEKRDLYFRAGAREVWLCSESGEMTFLGPEGPLPNSTLFPDFPRAIG